MDPTKPTSPQISIVIPAYNEAHNIGLTLESLINQQTRYSFEVIIVNNNSTDSTIDIAKSYQNQLHLTIIDEPQLGRGPARQTGVEHAQGEIILCTDADSITPPNWIESTLKQFSSPSVIAVTGSVKITNKSSINTHLFNIIQPTTMIIYRSIFGHYWITGSNSAIKKTALITSGGFNKSLTAYEDIDLSNRLAKLGKIKLSLNSPILTSDRRFESRFFTGYLEYLVNFIKYLHNKPSAKLSNHR